MSDPEFTSAVRLAWLPLPGQGGGGGRIMAYRTVSAHRPAGEGPDDSSGGAIAEFWLSPPVDEEQLFDADPVPSSRQWHRLALGQPVEALWATVPLRPADRQELQEILELLSDGRGRRRIRALLGLDARLRRSGSALTVRSARLRAVDGDMLIDTFRSIFDDTLTTLHRASPVPADVAGAPRPGIDRPLLPDRTLRADLAARIELEDVRGAMIGDRNLQIDRYVVRVAPGEIDFAELLGAPDVRALIERANSDPGNDAHRRALVDRLARSYSSFGPAPATLEVTGPGRERVGGFLSGLLSFQVQGLQIGDGNTQRNNFTYVVSTIPKAAELLRGNRPLARALAGCLCPAPGDAPNMAELDARYRAVLRGLDVAYLDGRGRGLQHALPGEGDVLRLQRVDGVTIGDRNRQRVSETIKVTELSFNDLHQRWQVGEKERARLEAQRLEAQRLEAQRLEAQRLEAQRLEAQRVEAQRVEAQYANRVQVARPQSISLY